MVPRDRFKPPFKTVENLPPNDNAGQNTSVCQFHSFRASGGGVAFQLADIASARPRPAERYLKTVLWRGIKSLYPDLYLPEDFQETFQEIRQNSFLKTDAILLGELIISSP